MNYSEAMVRLDEMGKLGINLGLERMKLLLKQMGDPQEQLKLIHIAGTNGKGSTSVMLSNILMHSGYTTGIFISPSVLCYRERMQINGEMIPEREFAECAEFVYGCVDQLAPDKRNVTQFELETAIAFEWYKRRNCDYVCLEVGLGGRLDATNVISVPVMQIITSIGFDHMNLLGDTLEKIAFEKAGIIKGGITVVYPLQSEPVMEVIMKKCNEEGSRLVRPDVTSVSGIHDGWKKSEFVYDHRTYHKSLPGKFQIYNCITVIEAAKELKKQGLKITDEDIEFGIGHTYFPARMEVLSEEPFIILDGSHNPDGAKALEQVLKEFSADSIIMIMGVLADKNYHQFLETVGPYADELIAVTPNNPRALDCKALCLEAEKVCKKTSYHEMIKDAVSYAVKQLNENRILVICGSLYLAAEIRPLLLSEIERSKGI